MAFRTITYTVPPPKKASRARVAFKTITIREVNGDDEQAAAKLAQAKGKPDDVMRELLRICIVKVDGRTVVQPFGEFDGWNSRSMKFALDAYVDLNGTSEDERDAFLSSAAEESVGSLLPSVEDEPND